MTQSQQSQFYEASNILTYVNCPIWGIRRSERLPFIRYDQDSLKNLINRRRDVLIALASLRLFLHFMHIGPAKRLAKGEGDYGMHKVYPISNEIYRRMQRHKSIQTAEQWKELPIDERLDKLNTIISEKERKEIFETFKNDLNGFVDSTMKDNNLFYSFGNNCPNFVDLSNVQDRLFAFFEITQKDIERIY